MSAPTVHVRPAPPTPPDAADVPRRASRPLLWFGLALSVLAIAQITYQGLDWMVTSTTTSTEVYAAAPVVEVTTDGDVTVTVGGPGTVTIEERTRTGFQRVTHEAVETDDRLAVEHGCPSWWSNGTCRVDLTVQVPQDTEVVVRSSSGAVRAEDVVGHLDLRTSDGDVAVLRAGGTVEAESGSGSVLVEGAADEVAARSGDGDVTVRDVGGRASARSDSGRVVVSGVGGDVEATSLDGDVVVHGTGGPVALDISTGDGRSTVEAPTDPAASRTVTIRSSSGDVSYLDVR
jgi:hypothetical protein